MRFYGWSDATLRATRWRSVLAYTECLPALQAEEQLGWLIIQHSADPRLLQRQLQKTLHQTPQSRVPRPEQVLKEWELNPFLRSGITIIETAP